MDVYNNEFYKLVIRAKPFSLSFFHHRNEEICFCYCNDFLWHKFACLCLCSFEFCSKWFYLQRCFLFVQMNVVLTVLRSECKILNLHSLCSWHSLFFLQQSNQMLGGDFRRHSHELQTMT